ncbi:TetR/AcrR family transcriptional regulator [Pleionea sp. CnH1-48]|uniref:TetR/AcrR family transcriptional regulator n=1 Tax=Pleionea sp. CnH1-48 TaxID=2954494 RepID=UPI0020979387|nr:TetR/AcrR family transcriptional regulator [Pleionea sp. CnH1-48]MCO7227285.1 TetR/AcrR family transcriptional regulator [Pleionea sp. CnH1-48]
MSDVREVSMINGLEDTPRNKLLSAAAHLFKTKGFERTTVRDLAKEVGIQSGSIFHHFKTKQDILYSLMVEVIKFNTERMLEAMSKVDNPQDKLLALIECELISINGETSEAMAVLVYEWRSLSEENQQKVLALREQYEQLWLDVIQDLYEQQQVSVAPFILRRLLTGAISWTINWYQPNGALNIEELATMVLQMAVSQPVKS